MKTPLLSTLFLCLVFTGIGLISGLYAGAGNVTDSGAADDAGAQAAPTLAPETLRNMGVVVAPAELSDFVQSTRIPAVIEASPASRQHLYAPVAGRIAELKTGYGALARSGEVLVTLIRDPLPRAQLTFTQNLLEPAGEVLHETMSSYLRALVSLENLHAERKRLEGVLGPEDDPVIPMSRLIQLRYQEKEAEQEMATLEHELERHGLSEQQIADLEHGIFPPLDVELWRSAMRNNGFWTPTAQRIYEALPENLQELAWTVATIGELVAGGFADTGLAVFFEQNEHACEHFLEIGGLLQRGHTLSDVENLLHLDVFENVVQVLAPSVAVDWDVEELLVRPGEHVEDGQPLLRLKNPRPLFLRVEPVGGEVESVFAALESGARMAARPMVPGAAPRLEELTFFRATYETAETLVVLASVTNRAHAERTDEAGRVFRTWRFGAGQRYLLELPRAVMENVYVLPAGAVTDDGPDEILFLQSGDTFTRIPVEILYRDHEVVVIPGDSHIFPGNPIVVAGAFPLGLALHASGGDSSDHGHSH